MVSIRRYAAAYRKRHKPGEMNFLEREYAQHLENLRKHGQIESYSFECETLKLGSDCRYTPDFRVLRMAEGYEIAEAYTTYIEFHEVKGTTRKKRTTTLEDGTKFYDKVSKPFIEDDSLVKIKAAAEMHPYKFVIVWKEGNEWKKKEIN
jgi:hypothetical protein